MSLSIGIVGLPNVGKSTLFKALTKKEVLIANYPFATIDPNIGVVAVPDERLDKLGAFSRSAQKIPAIVEFTDIAGLVRGANKGEGLGNQFLANIREVDAVLYVLRAFEDPEIQHVEARVDPRADFEILTTELMLKDLETVDKHLEKVKKQAKGNDKEALAELPILEKLKDDLSNGIMANKVFNEIDGEILKASAEKLKKELQLLTSKKGILLFNASGSDSALRGETPADFPVIDMNVREELDGAGFSDEERRELGLGASKLPELIRLAYETLGLIVFFTTGEKETRAWTVRGGATAPEAAGAIHSDFEKNFIRADVIRWDELLKTQSWVDAKAKGIVQTVGKEYRVEDGDVLIIKHGA